MTGEIRGDSPVAHEEKREQHADDHDYKSLQTNTRELIWRIRISHFNVTFLNFLCIFLSSGCVNRYLGFFSRVSSYVSDSIFFRFSGIPDYCDAMNLFSRNW